MTDDTPPNILSALGTLKPKGFHGLGFYQDLARAAVEKDPEPVAEDISQEADSGRQSLNLTDLSKLMVAVARIALEVIKAPDIAAAASYESNLSEAVDTYLADCNLQLHHMAAQIVTTQVWELFALLCDEMAALRFEPDAVSRQELRIVITTSLNHMRASLKELEKLEERLDISHISTDWSGWENPNFEFGFRCTPAEAVARLTIWRGFLLIAALYRGDKEELAGFRDSVLGESPLTMALLAHYQETGDD